VTEPATVGSDKKSEPQPAQPAPREETAKTADPVPAAEPSATTADAPAEPVRPNVDPLTTEVILKENWTKCLEGSVGTALTACAPIAERRLLEGDELATVQLKYANALRDDKQPEKAIAMYTPAIEAKPSASAYHGRAIANYDLGKFEPAIKDLDEAIRLDADNGQYINDRAWIRFQAGDPRMALRDADKAVSLLSRQGNVWDTRAHIHEALGNRDDAIRDFRKALSLDSKLDSSREGLSRLGAAP
jgi:tetratricopeptide (TPR) repeat protein